MAIRLEPSVYIADTLQIRDSVPKYFGRSGFVAGAFRLSDIISE